MEQTLKDDLSKIIIKKKPVYRKFELSKQFIHEAVTTTKMNHDYESIDLICQVFRYWYYVTFSREVGFLSQKTFLKHFSDLNYKIDKRGVYGIKLEGDFLVKSYRGLDY